MKKLILLLAIVGCFGSAKAQESMFNINWGISVPVYDLDDYVGGTSASGLNISGRKFIYDFFSVGGYAGWQMYYDKQDGLVQSQPGVDIWGTQLRHINVYPLMVNTHFYLGSDGGVRPYAGVNVGVSFVNQRVQVGLYEVTDTSAHFTISPEIGIYLPVGLAGGGFHISGRYEQAFQSSNDFHVQSVSLNLGFAIAY
ncbi:hypothetical protein BFP72_06955 [Reichenbachiella sp. 5M10]|uniref:hypothetical protein n=1 Tax=Reichenbachiella sp. 5M10 TaxID=1889772 RepID=UPI000C1474C7|nr:hypothetical protein [Reichenbachiella sp. 5M10]PIB35153.1 hypothetical protein BFP72_06955 [Reichenbachiella sp. 5M10]